MALSQSLSLKESNASTSANTSQVTVVWTSTQSGQSHNSNTLTGYYWISVNGGVETKYEVKTTLPANTTKTIVSITLTVPHRDDGSGNISVRTSIDTKISAGVVTKSANLTLTTIARASHPSLITWPNTTQRFNIGVPVTVHMNRKSGVFYHDVYYQINGNATKYPIGTDVTNNISWNTSELISFTAATKTLNGTVYATTYTKNANGNKTIIGTEPVGFTANVVNANPTINSFTVQDTREEIIALTGSNKIIVRGESVAEYSVSASTVLPATISNYKIINGNTTKTTASGSFTAPTSGEFTALVTDTRGNPSEEEKITLGYVDYITPLFTVLNPARPTTTSNMAHLVCSGTWFGGSFGVADNALELKYRSRLQGEAYEEDYTSLTLTTNGNDFSLEIDLAEEFNFQNIYELEFTLSDRLHNVTLYRTLPKGAPIIDIGENDVKVNGNLYVDGNIIADQIVLQGTDGIWIYRKWASGIAECWGLHTIENMDITGTARGSRFTTQRINFPSGLFVSGGSITVNVNSGLSAGFAYNGISGVPHPSYFDVIFVCQEAMSKVTAWCNIRAIGKWK